MTTNILDFDLDGLAVFCEQLGQKRFRATQLFRWIHQKGASDFEQMTDLAKSLREKLAVTAHVQGLKVVSRHESADGTILLEPLVELPARETWLFKNKEALASVEKGLKQSAEGKTKSLGSFAKHLEDDNE